MEFENFYDLYFFVSRSVPIYRVVDRNTVRSSDSEKNVYPKSKHNAYILKSISEISKLFF